jgi:outer membrane protein assembly factor BamE
MTNLRVILMFCILIMPIMSSCSFYKLDIQQGNVVTQEMLDQLEYAMPAARVRFIMGSPLLEPTFNSQRWEYVYSFQTGNSNQRQQRIISLIFDEQARLVQISGNVKPGKFNPESSPLPEFSDPTPIL